jgi:hypothetical protein
VTTEQKITALVDLAILKAQTPVLITKGDGSTYMGCQTHQSATDGDFQVYVIPVEQRSTVRKSHYRVTYYLRADGGQFKRVTRIAFIAAMDQKGKGGTR